MFVLCVRHVGIVAGLLVQNTLKHLLHFGVVSKYLGYNRWVVQYGPGAGRGGGGGVSSVG
jgi:hypothetical protein